MRNESPANIKDHYPDDTFTLPNGEDVGIDKLRQFVDNIVKVWWDGASGSPDGWCYTTYTVTADQERGPAEIVTYQAGTIGPSTEEEERKDLPDAEDIREEAKKHWDHIFIEP